MTLATRIETALQAAIDRAASPDCPTLLAGALRHAVFPGGARVRPNLCLAVAKACGDDAPMLSDAAAAAIELLHCASLAHDDLPCFDDSALRRGRPSVHAAFGEPIAVLAGDALIVLAFERLAAAAPARPNRLAALIALVGRAAGAPHGIAAGQAWESEPEAPLAAYHQAKTGALFVAATTAGALAAGADPGPWRALGEKLGAAYQVADDLLDAVAARNEGGKPAGRDAALNRPSAARDLGIAGARARLTQLVEEAAASVPDCAGAEDLRELVRMTAMRLAPKQASRSAA